MEVKLLITPEQFSAMEYNAAYAMLICHANTDKLISLISKKSTKFLKRAIKAGHYSVLEHITLTYEVTNLSRACLQELARHRHISLSVESTRHTLKEKIKDLTSKYLGTEEGMKLHIHSLSAILESCPNISNDELKYYIPEFWPTNLVLTANIRALRELIMKRTNSAALKEFQDLAHKLFEAVPDEFKYLLEDCVHEQRIS